MKKALVFTLFLSGLFACAATLSEDAARDQVKQLIVLYKENREKFILQKQEMVQAKDCGRAEALDNAVNKMVQDAAMSPTQDETLTMVKMELDQTKKDCEAK